jgi:hypothetical protein
MRIILFGTEKGGTIHLKTMEFFKGIKEIIMMRLVITKLNQAGLRRNCKGYKEVYVMDRKYKGSFRVYKNSLNTIQNKFEGDTNDFQSQFQWF